MFEYLNGRIQGVYPNAIVLDVAGLGYQVYCPRPYDFSDQLGQDCQVYVHLVVRDDALALYGFSSQEEKALFLKLNTVSGIGPKSALAILGAGNISGLVEAIEGEDLAYLTRFPGVGKKTAGQMILDLKGKLNTSLGSESRPIHQTQHWEEVKQALAGLGYSKREIDKACKALEDQAFDSTQDALSAAFTVLLK